MYQVRSKTRSEQFPDEAEYMLQHLLHMSKTGNGSSPLWLTDIV